MDLKASQRVKTLQGQQISVTKSRRGAHHQHGVASSSTEKEVHRQRAERQAARVRVRVRSARPRPQWLPQHRRVKDMGVKLASKFEDHRKQGNKWKWGGRRQLKRSSWLEALQRRMRERADAMRAARVFKKFDQNNSHYISLCEFENAMYKEEMQDGGNNNEGPVLFTAKLKFNF